jgi:hypothetical protein
MPSGVAQQRADRERRLEALAVEVLTALGERDGAVRRRSRRGGALLAMTDDGLSVREASNGVAAASHCGSHPAAPPGGPPRARCYKVNARRGSAAGLGAQNGTDLIAPASCGVTRDSGLEPEFTNIDIWQPGLPVLRAKMLAALRIRVAASVSSSPNISFACCRFGRERHREAQARRCGCLLTVEESLPVILFSADPR